MSYTYDYPRAMVCVDCILFANNFSEVLLIQRANEPFQKMWALPGGFIEMDETLEQSAARELCEETGLKDVKLNQFAAYGDPGRDPRGRTISVVFWAHINHAEAIINAGSDAQKAQWFSIEQLPQLAFDHNEIINTALKLCPNK